MKYLMVMLVALLVPTAALAKSECKEDKQKFCKDEAKENVIACLKQHKSELSEACKTKFGEKLKDQEGSDGTHTEPKQGATPDTDTKTIAPPEAH
jgi:hypothetical protein